MNPSGNYHSQAVDADVHLDWNNVLQILASGESQASSCPICLSPPVAARMAKCGHIFCLPCLIRYMHSTDDTNPAPEKKARWKKCPICWDNIYISDTRPLRWFIGQENPAPKEGEDVVLRLIMRQPGSTLALPRDGAEALAKSEDIPWYFAAEVTDYTRVMKGSKDYMIEQFNSEIDVLLEQEKMDELMFGEETQWTQKAVNAIRDAKERVKDIGNPPDLNTEPVERKPRREPIVFQEADAKVPEMYLIQHAAKFGQSQIKTPEEAHTTEKQGYDRKSELESQAPHAEAQKGNDVKRASSMAQLKRADVGRQDSPLYFYQALTHYYLSPLDIRILKTAFGNFSSFPSTILPRVEHVSTGHVVDDDLRKRTKYLGHLPHGCEVSFLECDWTDIVAPEILEQFSSEIERRRKRNHEKETREEKDRIRAERLEDEERWASARRKRSSEQDENLLSAADFLPLASSSMDVANSLPWGNRAGSSFATLASPSTSPDGSKTVWGTSIVTATSPEVAAQNVEAEVDDGWLQDWERELHADNDLIAQVQAASLIENGEGSSAGGPGAASGKGNGQGKKKKGKKITLMSTTARRAA